MLYLDIEGGTGGSARSLYFLITHLIPLGVSPWVVSLKTGPVASLYEKLGVDFKQEKGLLTLPTMLRNEWMGPLSMLIVLLKYPHTIRRIVKKIKEEHVDVVHVNHTTLFPTAFLIKLFCNVPVFMHVRVQNYPTFMNRLYAKLITRSADYFFFITENERETLLKLSSKKTLPHEVIYNISESATEQYEYPEEFKPYKNKFKIISLKNIHYFTGIDRLVSIAEILKTQGESRFLFVILGGVKEKKFIDGIKRDIAEKKLENYFLFLGSKENPEQYLCHSQMLINLSRKNNPWGRDIIEALSSSVPPIVLGSYDKFAMNYKTGLLYSQFDPAQIARDLISIIDNKGRLDCMKKEAVSHAEKLFSGPIQAQKIFSIYNSDFGSLPDNSVSIR